MVVDGIWWVDDVKLGRRCVKRVDQTEQETVWRTRELSTFETTAPADIGITTKHATTSTLKGGGWRKRLKQYTKAATHKKQ